MQQLVLYPYIYPSGMEGKTVFPTSTTDDVTSLSSWIKPLHDTAINCMKSRWGLREKGLGIASKALKNVEVVSCEFLLGSDSVVHSDTGELLLNAGCSSMFVSMYTVILVLKAGCSSMFHSPHQSLFH